MIQIITLNQNNCTSWPGSIVNCAAINDLKHYYEVMTGLDEGGSVMPDEAGQEGPARRPLRDPGR